MKTKKFYIALVIGLVVAVATYFAINKINAAQNTRPVKKENVSLIVYKNSSIDYSQSLYNKSTAQVRVTIEKMNTKGEATVLWEKIFDPEYLDKYPSAGDPIRQNVEINNLTKKNDLLVVSYNVIYNSNGNKMEIPYAVAVAKQGSSTVAISI
jgi:hypothetical protein